MNEERRKGNTRERKKECEKQISTRIKDTKKTKANKILELAVQFDKITVCSFLLKAAALTLVEEVGDKKLSLAKGVGIKDSSCTKWCIFWDTITSITGWTVISLWGSLKKTSLKVDGWTYSEPLTSNLMIVFSAFLSGCWFYKSAECWAGRLALKNICLSE